MEDQKNSTKAGSQYSVHDVEDPLPPQSVPPFRAASDDGQIVSQHERLGLVRGLSQRHVQMIAIAGAIVCGAMRTSKIWLLTWI